MKKFLDKIPGLRSDKIWFKAISGIYYFILLLSILVGMVDAFLILAGFGLLVFSVISLFSNRKNRKALNIPIVLLLISLLIFNAGTTVSSDDAKLEEQDKQIQTLISENEALDSKINELDDNIDKLEKEKESLKQDEKELKKLDEIKAENKELKKDNRSLKSEINDLEKEVESLKKSVKDLEAKKSQEQKSASSNKTSTKSSNKSSGGGGGGGSTKGAATKTGQGEVYITPTGSKYHKGACGRGNYSATTLADAKSRGLTPCGKCY